jgi:hypothetical protein
MMQFLETLENMGDLLCWVGFLGLVALLFLVACGLSSRPGDAEKYNHEI